MAATETTIDEVGSGDLKAATGSGPLALSSLPEIEPGEQARLVSIDDAMPTTLRARVMALGFVPGTLVRVVRRAPLGDPVEYELRGGRISLRKTEAAHLKVARC